jgi:penicillin V acylase-like amidase (Ntn superfamily)
MYRRLLVTILCILTPFCLACTSVALHWQGQMVTGRTFDWSDGSGFFVVSPKGVDRVAKGLPAGDVPQHWVTKYGSVSIHMARDNRPNPAAVVDGMNEKGLSVAVLELAQTRYIPVSSKTAVIGSAQFAEYLLDRFSSVAAVIKGLKTVHVVASLYHKLHVPLHYMIADAAGHSAVIEFLNGRLHLAEGVDLPVAVLTNTAYRNAVRELSSYHAFGGDLPAPGGYGSLARYVRAATYLSTLPKAISLAEANAYMFDILSDSAEPLGEGSTPTQWMVVRDNTSGVYYYRTADNPHVREIHLSAINFSKGQQPSWQRLHNLRRDDVTQDFAQ